MNNTTYPVIGKKRAFLDIPEAVELGKKLGEQMKLERVSQGLSIGELSDKANVVRQTVGNLETGRGTRIETLINIWKVLGYRIEGLLLKRIENEK